MDTLSQNRDLVQMMEYVACEFQRRCSHRSAQRLDSDSWYCPSCGSLVQQHEFDEL